MFCFTLYTMLLGICNKTLCGQIRIIWREKCQADPDNSHITTSLQNTTHDFISQRYWSLHLEQQLEEEYLLAQLCFPKELSFNMIFLLCDI